MGLRLYTVHLPSASAEESVPVLVKEGFSWPAFFLNIVWTLWHRLWIESAALLALFLALGVVLDYANLSDAMEAAILVAVAVLVGNSAADWRRQSLQRRGFRDGGVVTGTDIESALRRFLDLRAVELQALRPTTSAMPPQPVSPAAGSPAGGSIAGWYSNTFHQPAAGERDLADASTTRRSWNQYPDTNRTGG